MVRKEQLVNKVEPFIYSNLKENTYELRSIYSGDLLTWNRFDLAFKLFYLDNKQNNKKLSEMVYKNDIKAQTLGSYTEYGNEEEKNSLDIYISSFNKTFEDIKNNGFDEKKTLIPLSADSSVINGSHRIASAIFLNKNVTCIKTEQESMVADYKYFYDRGVSSDILYLVVKKFIEYSPNTYIAFLWPSGCAAREESESKFSNIVYKKNIKLTPTGGYNLLIELYKHMDWVGSAKNSFPGAKQKLIECFPNFDSFTVIVFQEDNLSKVRAIKESVRKIHNIGFSSIHITDTKEEAIRISKLIFNENGIHFLNFANPYKFTHLKNELNTLQSFIEDKSIKKSDVLIDGSVTLSVYGIRKNSDIDLLLSENISIKFKGSEYESHETELKYHRKEKVDLIYDPSYFFEYDGVKYVSFNQLYKMKINRGEKKDLIDCELMSISLENNNFKKNKAKLIQTIFYLKIKTSKNLRTYLINILSVTRLYRPLRYLYRLIKEF